MTKTQTPAERLLDQIESDERLAEAATIYGWRCSAIDPYKVEVELQVHPVFGGESVAVTKKIADCFDRDDTRFIAASRNIVPRQAAQLRLLIEALEEIHQLSDDTSWYTQPYAALRYIEQQAGIALEAAAAMIGDNDDAA